MSPEKKNPVREERKEWARAQRQERIISITARLLAKRDIEDITLEEIAKSAGYTIQNLYMYFKNKDDLLAAVLLKKLKVLHSEMEAMVAKAGSGMEQIMVIGEKFVDFYVKNRIYFDLEMRFEKKFYVYHRLPVRKTHGDFIVQCQKVTDQFGDMLVSAIESGIADGSIKTRLKPLHLMLLLWAQSLGVVQVITMRQKYFKDIYDFSAEKFRNIFRDSVLAYLAVGDQ